MGITDVWTDGHTDSLTRADSRAISGAITSSQAPGAHSSPHGIGWQGITPGGVSQPAHGGHGHGSTQRPGPTALGSVRTEASTWNLVL